MAEAEFDKAASDYTTQHAASIRASGETPDFFARYKAVDTRRIADAAGLKPRTILDFGSGIGSSVAPLLHEFPGVRLTCLDVSEKSLDVARRKNGDTAVFRVYDGARIPPDVSGFDIVFTACVFHHISKDQGIALLAQIRRVLNPGGRFILFEHNPWNPLTRHAVNICPFDANAVLISAPEMKRRLKAVGFTRCELRYRIFFPGALALLRPLERYLGWLPLGAQYYLSAY